MVPMVANKSFQYGGRRYRTGDRFSARRNDARVLEAIGRAAPETGPSAEELELDRLRADYERLTGGSPDGRWKADTLERKIEEASEDRRYRRRDMQAED